MRSTRLALAVAILALPAGGTPQGPPYRGAAVTAPALAPKLHIKSFTIVSPACDKPPQFRLEIQNLTGTPFEGNKTMSPSSGPEILVMRSPKSLFWMQGLPAVGGGATLSTLVTWPGEATACPSDTCWELALLSAGPGGTTIDLPEWDRKTARICAKTSCVRDPRRVERTPCTFEIYSPGPLQFAR
jgi:hypothetical protein